MEVYRHALEVELQTLQSELESIAVFDQLTGDWVAKPDTLVGEADPNAVADTTEDWNERRAMVGQLETRYRNVRLALDKFSAATYGRCEICEELIESDRLSANAAARTCKIHLERERELPF